MQTIEIYSTALITLKLPVKILLLERMAVTVETLQPAHSWTVCALVPALCRVTAPDRSNQVPSVVGFWTIDS